MLSLLPVFEKEASERREGRNHGDRPFPQHRGARNSPAADWRPGKGEIKLEEHPSPPRVQAGFSSRSDTHNLGINKVRRAVSAALSEAHPCGFSLPPHRGV
ncbi:hypothetical protein KUCAC02_012768, partial [Chaenocephalus aceratus]